MRKGIRLVIAGIIALLLAGLAGTALAASAELSFVWTVEGQKITVQPEKKKNGATVLYLPGACKGQDPVVSISPDMDLVWNGITYPNGSTLPVSQFAGKEVEASYSAMRGPGTIKVMQGSEIPALFITATEQDIKRISGTKERDIRDPAGMVMIDGDGHLNAAELLTSLKTRGNSTFEYARKKSYSFKMQSKANLGGMGRNKKWLLLANWFDVSLIRNQITYDLFREVGFSATPDCRSVDLYINAKYNGTYLLTEKIQLKKNRLEITDLEEQYEAVNGKTAYDNARFRAGRIGKLNARWYEVEKEPEDLTGGYLLEVEKPLHFSINKDGAGFITDMNMRVIIKEPTHVGRQGVEYISSLVNDFNNAASDKSGYNSAGKYYADYIDMRSFALKVAIDEFCANYDVRAASQFMYKDSDKADPLLHAGPGWDYDLSYGNKNDGMNNPERLDFVFRRTSDHSFLYRWLLTHEDFQELVRKVYDEEIVPASEILTGHRKAPEGSALRSIDEYQTEIAASAAMNYTRWSPKGISDIYKPSGLTFDDACTYLKNWITVRTNALSKGWEPGRSTK